MKTRLQRDQVGVDPRMSVARRRRDLGVRFPSFLILLTCAELLYTSKCIQASVMDSQASRERRRRVSLASRVTARFPVVELARSRIIINYHAISRCLNGYLGCLVRERAARFVNP